MSSPASAGSVDHDGSGRPLWRHPAVLAALAVVGSLLLVAAGLWLTQRGQVLPNVSVAGVEVGGMDRQELDAALDDVAGDREHDEVVFTFEDERFTLVPADVGYRVDRAATREAALAYGRGDPVSSFVRRASSLWADVELGLVEDLDEQALDAAVDELADEVDRDTTTAEVRADPETLEVELELPRGAAEVRREETREVLLEALRREGPDELPLPADVEDPPSDPEEAEQVAQQVEDAIAEPLALRAAGEELTIDPTQLAELISVEAEDDGPLQLRVHAEDVEEVLGAAADERFGQTPVSASYGTSRTPPTTFTDMGSTTWSPVEASVSVSEGRDGRELDPEDAADALTDAVREAAREAETELRRTEPSLPNDRAQELRPTHLLGTFTTAYQAGQTRVANIQRLADVIDDTLVLPGEQFSINQISGERSCSKGYEPAGTIVRGELVDTCGGGVSQFGTTTYNAAYFSGVQLDAWRAHSFYISRYPAGREATLSFPQLDVRFTNDTDGAIVVRASYTSTSVTVSLYGRPIAESVSASHGSRTNVREPTTETRTTSELPEGETRTVQSEGSAGFTIDVTRTVRYRDGREETSTDRTVYEPQNGIEERGTG